MAKHTLKNTARSLKYVWPFYNIMHERVNNNYRSFPEVIRKILVLKHSHDSNERTNDREFLSKVEGLQQHKFPLRNLANFAYSANQLIFSHRVKTLFLNLWYLVVTKMSHIYKPANLLKKDSVTCVFRKILGSFWE